MPLLIKSWIHPVVLRAASWVLLGIPLLAAISFVVQFGSPLPLTDEWGYTHALRKIDGIPNLWSLDGLREILAHFPTHHAEHIVVVPFLIYWPVIEWAHFDSRWIIALTVASFAVQVWNYRAMLGSNVWALVPVSMIMMAPSHFMEFIWGWQLTLALSVLFPLWGLRILDGLNDESSQGCFALHLGLGLTVIELGQMSAAGGFFGFAAAVVLFATKPLGMKRKLIAIGVTTMVAVLVFHLLVRTGANEPHLGMREIWYVLTALGAALWGSPVGLTEFGFDVRSVGGILVILGILGALARCWLSKQRLDIALPVAVTLFGFLCVLPIAMVRSYLGNWHVQYILPALCGAWGIAWRVWRADRSRWAMLPVALIGALLASSLVGYQQGFTVHGPNYRDYVRSIEEHGKRELIQPGGKAPYPPQHPERDFDARLLLFLAGSGNPLFANSVPTEPGLDLPVTASVFVDNQRLEPAVVVLPPGMLTITVTVPRIDSPARIEAFIGPQRLPLWRVHPANAPEAVRSPGAVHFMATLVPEGPPVSVSSIHFKCYGE